MRYAIETAPKDGKGVIIEDDASGTYDVAHWSAEAGEWVGKDGEPSKITPTHWRPMPRSKDKNILQGGEVSNNPSQVGPSASRARRHSFFPSSSIRAASPQSAAPSDLIASRSAAMAAPVRGEALEAQAAPIEAKRAPRKVSIHLSAIRSSSCFDA